jgi:hypothetical protein
MKFFNSPSTWRIVPLLALVAGLTMNGRAAVSGDNGKAEFISLRDFAREEVKGAGFTLAKETAVTVTATGGADKSFWDTFNDSDENRSGLYAGGWIIDAKTRRTIWEMTRNNTSGTSAARHCAETVTLKPGAYEVYFAAYGYASSSGLSQISANIDRREPARSHRRDVGTFFKELFGYGEDFVEAFMDHAKNDWGIALSVDEPDRSGIALFNAPQTPANVLLSTTRIGDGAMVRKTLTVPHETDVRVYAIGEGRGTREMFDYA